MKITEILTWFVLIIVLAGCSTEKTDVDKEQHLIKDADYREKVEKRFLEKKQLAVGRNDKLFEVFNGLSVKETEALKFLYAFMPLSDLADYSGEYFRDIVKITLEARDSMAWGHTIPDDIFMHFVLPYRINNENLDTFRVAMYNELKERVAGLSLKDAVLEVNHWCHEKVSYKGADIRTSAPLSTIRTSWGRCGEESTFTVAALRTIGIPARQCYTPRWAHSDDNHAWVEVWIDGEWSFLGACEPLPNLNTGWFKEPARRTMLVHTKAFGMYTGNESTIKDYADYSELNLLKHYAKTRELTVKVVDENEKPVEGAKVNFLLYNYAELYPILSKQTGNDGKIKETTGLGDLVIWVSKNGAFGYEKISVENTSEVIVRLDKKSDTEYSVDFDLIPPIKRPAIEVEMTGEAKNQLRLEQEDSIRTLYISTFMTAQQAKKLAEETSFDTDSVLKYIDRSEGNWEEIATYLKGVKSNKSYALKLLDLVSLKDLRDTKAEILLDHLHHSTKYSQNIVSPHDYAAYILSPRIANEMLVAYRLFLQNKFGELFAKQAKENPLKIVEWIEKNLTINNDANYYKTPISPVGVYELKVTDIRSRDFFFVAVCRSLGIMAKFNRKTLKSQYFDGEKWLYAPFNKSGNDNPPKGFLSLKNSNKDIDPKYYVNFTIAEFIDGEYKTIGYEWNKPVSEFTSPLEVNSGNYMLVTGNRLADGSVLSKLSFFNLKEAQNRDLDITLRNDITRPEVIANIDTDIELNDYKTNKAVKIKDLFNGKSSVIVWLNPDREPSKHVMADIPAMNKIFNKWGGSFVFVLLEDKLTDSFNTEMFKNLPENSRFVIDKDKKLISQLEKEIGRNLQNDLPLAIISGEDGSVIFLSEGYTIGIDEQIVKTLQKMGWL